jgi:hypothetical protein
MNLLKKKILIISIICLASGFLFGNIARANDVYETGTILPECIETGNCSLCDILKAFANFADFIISIVGSIALLLFLYGGYVWMTSAGNQERIKRGRDVIISTIIGVILVLGAWQIINFTVSAFVSPNPATTISFKLFTDQPWYQYCNQSLPCVNKNEGDSCGDYLVCSEQGLCITECSYKGQVENKYYSCVPFCETANQISNISCPNENDFCCETPQS